LAQNLLGYQYDAMVYAKVWRMKYLFALLIIPMVPILLIAVFGIGALYFGVTNQIGQKMQ
jgi:hypothetical protein